MKCFWLFFHDWSKWGDAKRFGFTYLSQKRNCKICGLTQEKIT